MAAAERRPTSHVAALDGLRGLAALVVVIRHSFNTVAIPVATREAVLQTPLALVLNAQGAVQLFFVLSGYVLASSLSRSRRSVDLAQYCVKRVFRIHPPYVAAVLFAWTASFFYPDIAADAGVSAGFRYLASIHIEVPQLLASLLFPGQAHLQLPVGWTLRVEMIFSLLLPLLVVFGRRTNPLALIAVGVGCLIVPSRTAIYALDFALGVAAFLERDRLVRWLHAAPPWLSSAGVIVGLVLLNAPLLLGWSTRAGDAVVGGFRPVEIFVMGAGAATLIVTALGVSWWECLLASRSCRFLGRISYSLYLVHGPVLVLCTPLLAGPPSLLSGAIFFVSVASISIAISSLAYRFVERPAIGAGNALCRRLASRAGSAPVEFGQAP